MAHIEAKLQATHEAIAENEARLQQALANLAHSARPTVQAERVVARRPRSWWIGAFAAGVALGWLHGRKRRLLS